MHYERPKIRQQHKKPRLFWTGKLRYANVPTVRSAALLTLIRVTYSQLYEMYNIKVNNTWLFFHVQMLSPRRGGLVVLVVLPLLDN